MAHYRDYKAEDLPDKLTELSQKYTLIIDAVGRRGQLDRVMGALAPGGKIAIYGVDDFGSITLNPAGAAGSFTFANEGYNEGEAHGAVMEFVESGRLRPGNYCDLENIHPLEHISDAFEAVGQRRADKALVKLS